MAIQSRPFNTLQGQTHWPLGENLDANVQESVTTSWTSNGLSFAQNFGSMDSNFVHLNSI